MRTRQQRTNPISFMRAPLIMLCMILAGAGCVFTANPDEPLPLVWPEVSETIRVSPEQHELWLVTQAEGVQIYACAIGANNMPAWTLYAPDADLVNDAGVRIGRHYGGVTHANRAPGPYWESFRDGSYVHADSAGAVKVAQAGSIPLLLLPVADTSGDVGINGMFAPMSGSWIQRLDTTGGTAPPDGCMTAQDVGKQIKIGYTANYYFYKKLKSTL